MSAFESIAALAAFALAAVLLEEVIDEITRRRKKRSSPDINDIAKHYTQSYNMYMIFMKSKY
jgi:hypothetical protein